MVLRPILDLIDTLDVILKNDEFSWFSIFWIVGFDTYPAGYRYPAEYRPIDVIFQEST